MSSQTTSYSFEETSTERTDIQAQQQLNVFLTKLGISGKSPFDADQTAILIRYVKSVQLNIIWYTESKDKQLSQVRLYITLSLIMLLVIPLIVFIVGLVINIKLGQDLSAETIFAMISGFVTAILAFQQAAGSILRGQIRVKEFWEALSGLKQLLFALQDRWKGKVVGGSAIDAFIEEIKLDTAKAQAIAQKEQDSFFSNYTVQDVNIGTLLSGAKATATSMIDKLQSYELSQKYAAEKKALEDKNALDLKALTAKLDSGQAALKKELRKKELEQIIKTQEEIAKLYEKRIAELIQENTTESLANVAAARLKFHAAVDAKLTAEAELKVL